jgi:hypothetical protein
MAESDTTLFVQEVLGMWTEPGGMTTITEYDGRGSDQ